MALLERIRIAFMVLLVMTVFTVTIFRMLQSNEYAHRKLQVVMSRAASLMNAHPLDSSLPHVHLFHTKFGHTGELSQDLEDVTGHYGNNSLIDMSRHIAIGCGLTSRVNPHKVKLGHKNVDNTTAFPIFTQLLPSFCRTASPDFIYHFYFSFDFNDEYFSNQNKLAEFQNHFDTVKCPHMNISIHFVQCNHSGNPAWAQNDAMMEAYIDNIEYFYRINDDTIMTTKNWTNIFVERLKKFDPPNVGMVGPNHAGGNTGILTYDFVHKTHMNIFGFYYPRIFTDWYADDWITQTYREADGRCEKIISVRLRHTMSGGKRYIVHGGRGRHLRTLVLKGANLIKR
jgi:hypothetical protein